ncbi:MAG TPA: LPS export ABC transporter periplasmic protein LptC [Flavobacteriales bacterium]|nr:LPS export ABC transporter periplasmic protein LptC [Flavobacteriales bacterium]
MQERSSVRSRILLIPALIGAGMFFSCENDLQEVDRVARLGEIPQETMEEVRLVYTDSGETRAILETPLIHKFYQPRERMEFPNGLQLTFYQKGMKMESRLCSEYGILNQAERHLLVRNNVVFINFIRQDTLNTELLNWSQDSARVYTDKQVVVRGKTGVFTSRGGLQAGEAFDWYEFNGVAATYYYNSKTDE